MTRPRNPTRTAIATVRQLFDLIETTGLSYREVARRMGLSYVTLSKWKNGDKSPTLQNIENALQAIGYRLDVVPLETAPPVVHLRGEVTHEDICNTHEGGPCNCDWSAAEGGLHPDDLAVDRFAAAKKRDEGRGGWEDKEHCSNAFLSEMLLEHVAKGDPVDVGNLAMMVHQRGESICVLTERVAAISQLHAIVDAWEALPGGRQVRNSDVEHWLAKHMGPGIDAIRGFLRRPRPDGILPPPPQTREVGE